MNKSKLGIFVVATIANQVASGVVHGAEAESYTQLDEVVVVATKIPTPYAQVAASVTVVDSSDIDALAASDFRDAIAYQPGLTLRRDASRFGLDSIAIRGIGGNRVALLVDGVPLSKGFAIGSYSDSGRPLEELQNVRRIEVLRGPASALYGSDAIGGVVSVTTFDPADILHDDVLGASLRTGYAGSRDELRAGFDGAAEFGVFQSLLSYTHRDGGDIDTTGSLAPNPREATSDALSAKLVMPDAPGGRMRLMGSFNRSNTKVSVNSLLRTPGRFINTTALTGDDSAESYRIVLDQSLEADRAGDMSGEWRVYWTQTAVEQLSDERRVGNLRIDRSFDLQTSLIGGEFTGSRRVDGRRVQQRWVYGVEANSAKITELRNGLQTDLTTQTSTNVVLGESLPVRDFPESELIEAGAYLQDEIRIDERWSFIPALRVDYYDLKPKPDDTYLLDNPATTPVSVTETSLTPKLGLVYTVADDVSLFAQYAQGFRAQPFEDVNIGLDIPAQNIRAIPNPDLKPERSHGYELGMRIEREAVQASVSAYYTDYRDFIESKVNLGLVNGVILFQSRNVAEARIFGMEATAQFDLGHWANAFDGWRAATTAAWSQGDDTVNDRPLNSVDPAQAIVRLGYASPTAQWSSDVAVTVVEGKHRVTDPTGRTALPLARSGSYALVDAFLHFSFADRVQCDIALLNVLDREYRVWSDIRGRMVNDPQLPLFYQPGRNISATLSYRW